MELTFENVSFSSKEFTCKITVIPTFEHVLQVDLVKRKIWILPNTRHCSVLQCVAVCCSLKDLVKHDTLQCVAKVYIHCQGRSCRTMFLYSNYCVKLWISFAE